MDPIMAIAAKIPRSGSSRIGAGAARRKGLPGWLDRRHGRVQLLSGKNLGACGEGGAITSRDRAHTGPSNGSAITARHRNTITTARAITAASTRFSARYCESSCVTSLPGRGTAARRGALQRRTDPILPKFASHRGRRTRRHVYHLFVIRADRRDDLQSYLTSSKSRTGLTTRCRCTCRTPMRRGGWKRGDYAVWSMPRSTG